MSEVDAKTSSQAPEASSQMDGQSQDSVSYDSFRKSVEQEKRLRSRAQELEDKVKQLELQEHERQGNYQTVIDKLKEENAKLKEDNTNKDKVYGWSNLESSIKQEALKHGCVNPDKFIKLLDKSDLSVVKLDGKYQADNKDIQMLVEKAKSENTFLFKNKSIPVADGVPNGKISKPDPVDVGRMSAAQLKEFILNSAN